MEEYQMRSSIILMVTIPVRSFEGFLALDPWSAVGTQSLLLVQDLRTQYRGCPPCELAITVLEVRLPLWLERVGVALDLDGALRFDRLLSPDDLLATRWISAPPGCAPLMGQGAWCDPAARLLRGAVLGPSIPPSPNTTIQLGACLGTDDVPMVVGPAP
jgi:hypothetical protein